MNVSILSSGTMAQTTASMVDTQMSKTSQPQTPPNALPSGDTVQISAEARSLFAQMTPVATATSRLTYRSNSAGNPTQKSTPPLRLVSSEEASIVEETTDSLEKVTVTVDSRIVVEGNSSTTTTQQPEQIDAEQEPMLPHKAQQQSEEKQQTAKDENKTQPQLRKVETEISRAHRDITFLVGRAAINESAREQLNEKKSELSVLMVELLQLESVSTNSFQ